jgi:ABC-type lipoprotein release transport system permease subunit
VAGVAGGFLLARVAGGFVEEVRLPGALTLTAAAVLLAAAALLASLVPAARAARVDVIRALRPE